MTEWRIALAAPASKQLAALDPSVRKRIVSCLRKIPDADVKKLQGEPMLYRARVGAWRILFRPNHDTMTIEVVKVAKRDEAYR